MQDEPLSPDHRSTIRRGDLPPDAAARCPSAPWAARAAWALEVVHDLADRPSRPGARQQALIDAVCLRYDAAGSGCIFHRVRDAASAPSATWGESDVTDDPIRILSRTESRGGTGPAERAVASSHQLVSRIDLGDARHAVIALARRPDAPKFDDVDGWWLATLHAGCQWVYASNGAQVRRRLGELTPREREALGHLLNGASEKEIAARLARSRHTVHAYVKRIYRTLGVKSRAELLVIFVDADGVTSARE